jgi:hypothetical protein
MVAEVAQGAAEVAQGVGAAEVTQEEVDHPLPEYKQ